MIEKKKLQFGMFFLVGLILLIGFIGAYQSTNNVQVNQFMGTTPFVGGSSLEFDSEFCNKGDDFVLQLAPFGCTPSVVRDDLLEEQNVPVYCQLAATKINPLINVKSIDSIAIKGDYPDEIAGVGFQPAQAALGVKPRGTSPVLQEIGTAIIVLKKQPNSSAIPEFVEGTAKVNMKYDIKNAFGIGTNNFHVPVLTDAEWEEEKTKYSFWGSKGYVRVEDLIGDKAVVSIYDGTHKIKSVNLEKGKTSEKIFLPGLECYSSLRVKLQDVEAPSTRAKLLVDNDYIEVVKGEKFLEGACTVQSIFQAGIVQDVTILCNEDEGEGFFGLSKPHKLRIAPKLNISIDYNGKLYKDVGVGDLLYTYEQGSQIMYVYLAYAGYKGNSGKMQDFQVGLMRIPEEVGAGILKDSDLDYAAEIAKSYEWQSRKGKGNIANFVKNGAQGIKGAASNLVGYLVEGRSITFVGLNKQVTLLGEQTKNQDPLTKKIPPVYGERVVEIVNFSESIDIPFDDSSDALREAKKNYDLATEDFEDVINDFTNEKYEAKEAETFGEKALFEKIRLNKNLQQKKTLTKSCDEFKEKYPSSELMKDVRNHCEGERVSNQEISEMTAFINGRVRRISLDGVYEPDFEEFGADISIRTPGGRSEVITLKKNQVYYLDDLKGAKDRIIDLGVEKDWEDQIINYYTLGVALAVRGSTQLRYDQDKGWMWNFEGSEPSGWIEVAKGVSDKFRHTLGVTGMGSNRVKLVESLNQTSFEEGMMVIYAFKGFRESIELLELEPGKAKVRVSVLRSGVGGVLKNVQDFVISDTQPMLLNNPASFGSDFTFTMTNINLQQNARITIDPGINKAAGSETNFSFKIGIEKRAIQLSPAKTRSMIKNLNKTLDKWQETSDKLAKVVTTLKKACLVGGTALTLMNLVSNLGGKGIAREKAMKDWRSYCAAEQTKGTYKSASKCYQDKSDEIDKTVDIYLEELKTQQTLTESRQKDYIVKGDFLQESTVNTKLSMEEKTIPGVKKSLQDKDGKIWYTIPGSKKPPIDLSDSINAELYEKGTFSQSQLIALEEDSRLAARTDLPSEISGAAAKRVESLKGQIYSSSIQYKDTVSINGELENSKAKGITSVALGSKEGIIGEYSGGTATAESFVDSEGKALSGTLFPQKTKEGKVINYEGQVVRYKGVDHMLFLRENSKGDYVVDKSYVYDGVDAQGRVKLGKNTTTLTQGTFDKFKKYDDTSYSNKYNGAEVQYYETPPYQGMPAIVPINLEKGWYAATKQTISGFGAIQAFDKSGRVASFYLGNVGKDKVQGFKIGGGDDIYAMVNLGTGQAYNQFPGLGKEEAAKYIACGVQAIEQASKQYGEKIVKISTACGSYSIKVGTPALDIPDMQCENFMSPSDCNIIYNLCDPVICPNSRCDFGGEYPVKDPIQTGIIGGLMLCLPNFGNPLEGGVAIPICLSGVQAGVDGLLSLFQARRDCLQENLDTGQTVGICDEMHSIYLCDLLWKQALPLLEIGIPKLIAGFSGKSSTRGGGEYQAVQNAWSTTKKSVDYLTQYYGANAFAAFKLRSTKDIGSFVCKNFVSGVVPTAEIFDQLTQPDSPPQFHGTFDEIPFTTQTNPPTSHYKTFYHIFAGKDTSGFYKVYLKGSPESGFYQDATSSLLIDQGYLTKGQTVSETDDRTAPSGYKELCINVNGQEECGFKQVTTSFALDYVADKYIEQQAGATDIKSESECISGSASALSLLNPNLQAGVSDALNPGIYKQGIIRVCSTANPGAGSDSKAGMNGSRWREVGHCGDTNLKCWIDTSKIKEITNLRSTGDELLENLNENTQTILQKSGQYIDNEYKDIKKGIEGDSIRDPQKALEKIKEIMGKIFFNVNKADLLVLRGNIYHNLAFAAFGEEQEARTKLASELEKKAQEERLKELVFDLSAGTETWPEIRSAFSATELQDIESSQKCSDCGGALLGANLCDEKECYGMGIYLGTRCVFKPYPVVNILPGKDKGSCAEEVKDTFDLTRYQTRTKEYLARALDYAKENVVGGKQCNWEYKDELLIDAIDSVTKLRTLPDSILLLSMIIQESQCNVSQEGGLMGIDNTTFDLCKARASLRNIEEVKGVSNYASNLECGATALRGHFNLYEGKPKVFECTSIRYSEWDAALRGYDGYVRNINCSKPHLNHNYVKEVTTIFGDIVRALSGEDEKEEFKKIFTTEFYDGRQMEFSFENLTKRDKLCAAYQGDDRLSFPVYADLSGKKLWSIDSDLDPSSGLYASYEISTDRIITSQGEETQHVLKKLSSTKTPPQTVVDALSGMDHCTFVLVSGKDKANLAKLTDFMKRGKYTYVYGNLNMDDAPRLALGGKLTSEIGHGGLVVVGDVIGKGFGAKIEGDTFLVVANNVRGTLGESANGGEIIVFGNVEGEVGKGMLGGRILVHGSINGRVGTNMHGGHIGVDERVTGNVGTDMYGGTIYTPAVDGQFAIGQQGGKVIIGDTVHEIILAEKYDMTMTKIEDPGFITYSFTVFYPEDTAVPKIEWIGYGGGRETGDTNRITFDLDEYPVDVKNYSINAKITRHDKRIFVLERRVEIKKTYSKGYTDRNIKIFNCEDCEEDATEMHLTFGQSGWRESNTDDSRSGVPIKERTSKQIDHKANRLFTHEMLKGLQDNYNSYGLGLAHVVKMIKKYPGSRMLVSIEKVSDDEVLGEWDSQTISYRQVDLKAAGSLEFSYSAELKDPADTILAFTGSTVPTTPGVPATDTTTTIDPTAQSCPVSGGDCNLIQKNLDAIMDKRKKERDFSTLPLSGLDFKIRLNYLKEYREIGKVIAPGSGITSGQLDNVNFYDTDNDAGGKANIVVPKGELTTMGRDSTANPTFDFKIFDGEVNTLDEIILVDGDGKTRNFPQRLYGDIDKIDGLDRLKRQIDLENDISEGANKKVKGADMYFKALYRSRDVQEVNAVKDIIVSFPLPLQ